MVCSREYRSLSKTGVGATSLLTLATAVVARASFSAFIVLRVLEGIAEGVTFPSIFAIMARWSPVQERSFLLAISTLGSVLGTTVTLPVSAVLCQYGFAGGWPSVFYITGLLGCVWFIFWVLIASDMPEEHRFISEEEKKYIIESRDATFAVRKPVPWASILTSRAVWMIALIKFCGAWSFYTLLTELPSYLADVLHFNIRSVRTIIPLFLTTCYVLMYIQVFNGNRLNRYLLNLVCIFILHSGLLGQAVGMVGATFAGCDWMLAFAMLLVASSSSGALYGSESVLPVDIAAQYAGAVMGFANCISNSAGIFTPLVVGYLTESSESIEQWNKVFFTSAGVVVFGAVAFLLFGKAEVEPWARGDQEPLTMSNNEKQCLIYFTNVIQGEKQTELSPVSIADLGSYLLSAQVNIRRHIKSVYGGDLVEFFKRFPEIFQLEGTKHVYLTSDIMKKYGVDELEKMAVDFLKSKLKAMNAYHFSPVPLMALRKCLGEAPLGVQALMAKNYPAKDMRRLLQAYPDIFGVSNSGNVYLLGEAPRPLDDCNFQNYWSSDTSCLDGEISQDEADAVRFFRQVLNSPGIELESCSVDSLFAQVCEAPDNVQHFIKSNYTEVNFLDFFRAHKSAFSVTTGSSPPETLDGNDDEESDEEEFPPLPNQENDYLEKSSDDAWEPSHGNGDALAEVCVKLAAEDIVEVSNFHGTLRRNTERLFQCLIPDIKALLEFLHRREEFFVLDKEHFIVVPRSAVPEDTEEIAQMLEKELLKCTDSKAPLFSVLENLKDEGFDHHFSSSTVLKAVLTRKDRFEICDDLLLLIEEQKESSGKRDSGDHGDMGSGGTRTGIKPEKTNCTPVNGMGWIISLDGESGLLAATFGSSDDYAEVIFKRDALSATSTNYNELIVGQEVEFIAVKDNDESEWVIVELKSAGSTPCGEEEKEGSEQGKRAHPSSGGKHRLDISDAASDDNASTNGDDCIFYSSASDSEPVKLAAPPLTDHDTEKVKSPNFKNLTTEEVVQNGNAPTQEGTLDDSADTTIVDDGYDDCDWDTPYDRRIMDLRPFPMTEAFELCEKTIKCANSEEQSPQDLSADDESEQETDYEISPSTSPTKQSVKPEGNHLAAGDNVLVSHSDTDICSHSEWCFDEDLPFANATCDRPDVAYSIPATVALVTPTVAILESTVRGVPVSLIADPAATTSRDWSELHVGKKVAARALGNIEDSTLLLVVKLRPLWRKAAQRATLPDAATQTISTGPVLSASLLVE
ncbi:hypothetical protein HPB52_008435 [Rhipicephalus sanguineus]|uniref:Major facilitator superfamily (MFS) profile domain-containing protein n=1 Tax=Rhipicephalus sanguineus TaxID=34632 RepID=A0A9D4Q6B6_RHISA|nr:hypothetical protein HPB52_008435 [Rhipicephalus sanguineus]